MISRNNIQHYKKNIMYYIKGVNYNYYCVDIF